MKAISNSGSFTDFLNSSYIYIDKTETIYKLLTMQKKVFISRPRRFGKSLTLDTIGTLFEKGVDPYFKNTWIYDKWSEPSLPVLRIDFLKFSVTDINEFKSQFVLCVSNFARKHNVTGYLENNDPGTSLNSLLENLSDEEKRIIILIDEYDCQLTANINNKDLYEMYREIIRSLYAIIEANSRAIRFLAVTGVTRLKDTTIFSVGSDIDDISNESAYSQLIGFTREEIKTFYIDYLKLAASYENKVTAENVTEEQIENMLDKLAENYDGYCFDENGIKKVFSTWSVNKFFQAIAKNGYVKFGDYWYDNGGIPSILANHIKSHELNASEYLEKNNLITVPIETYTNPTSLLDIDQNVLMCQTGYLTLKRSLSNTPTAVLGIPNHEVYRALNSLLALKIFETIDINNKDGYSIFDIGTVDEIISLLNTALNSVSYEKFPINNEAHLVSIVQSYMYGARQNVIAQQNTSKGRADLAVETSTRRIIFEFKYAVNESDTKTKLIEAIKQIKSRDYGNILPAKKLIRIAAVFNAENSVRAITEYQQV